MAEVEWQEPRLVSQRFVAGRLALRTTGYFWTGAGVWHGIRGRGGTFGGLLFAALLASCAGVWEAAFTSSPSWHRRSPAQKPLIKHEMLRR
jgi:hypothetical protein